MKIVFHAAIAVLINTFALWLTSLVLPNFHITPDLTNLLVVGLILTALNFLVRPILKFMLWPFIVLTLGLGLILLNAFILYLLDLLSKNITIYGVLTYIFAAVIIGAVNFIFHLFTR